MGPQNTPAEWMGHEGMSSHVCSKLNVALLYVLQPETQHGVAGDPRKVDEAREHEKAQKDAQILMDKCKETHTAISTIESCTGGLLAHLLTNVRGAASVYWGSVVGEGWHSCRTRATHAVTIAGCLHNWTLSLAKLQIALFTQSVVELMPAAVACLGCWPYLHAPGYLVSTRLQLHII